MRVVYYYFPQINFFVISLNNYYIPAIPISGPGAPKPERPKSKGKNRGKGNGKGKGRDRGKDKGRGRGKDKGRGKGRQKGGKGKGRD